MFIATFFIIAKKVETNVQQQMDEQMKVVCPRNAVLFGHRGCEVPIHAITWMTPGKK
jgi:predicted glycosyl hydrolase (DUF1957 family)